VLKNEPYITEHLSNTATKLNHAADNIWQTVTRQ